MKKYGVILFTGMCLLLMAMAIGCSKNAEGTALKNESDAASENLEVQIEKEKHYWANWQGELFDSANAPGGVDESLDTLVWMAFRDGAIIAEDQLAEEDSYIVESNRILEGSEEVSDNVWFRIVQEPFISEEGSLGQISHKDYIFYRQGEDAYIGVQSAEDDDVWTICKIDNYGDWLEKEIKIYIRMTTGLEVSDEGLADASNEDQISALQGEFIPISALLASDNSSDSIEEQIAIYGKIPIEQYTGIYEKVTSAESTVLSANIGISVPGEADWYYVSGHTDMQYLIRNENQEYSLWKFLCFDQDEYPYLDVLELVYQIDSQEGISEIEVRPPAMDNTDGGKAIQEEIGIHTIADRTEIDSIYQILSSLTCYGSNHWDMIDYGAVDAPVDAEPSHQAVLLGRYLSIVTNYGNEIDGLKYTAVSNMFYEFTGIAYNQLSAEQADSVNKILGISAW